MLVPTRMPHGRVFSFDVYMNGKLPVAQCAPALQTIHLQADRIFAGAISERLHEAMEPVLRD